MHVSTDGAGPALVLLHGWGMHSDVWEPVVAPLATGHRVIRVDLPGHGRSVLGDAPFTLDGVVDRLAGVVPERAMWMGWSMGGMVAMQFAARFPERVERLVLVASNPRFVRAPDWPCAMDAQVLAQFAEELERDHRATLLRFLALQTRGAEDERGTLRNLRERLFAYGPPAPEALRGGLAVLRDADLRAAFSELRMPTQLILGARDALVPVALADRLPGARIERIQGAGHAPFLSHPRAFLAAARGFLDG